MISFTGTELREIYLTVPSSRRRWERLLAEVSLTPGEVPDYVVGVFDADDELIGTAALHGDIIKYVAIHPAHQGESIANTLISSILSYAANEGISNPVIFTKPEYESLFTDLSFHLVGRTATSVMLEKSKTPLLAYTDYLKEERKLRCPDAKDTGVIIMNANPPTRGHLHLISESARKVDHLFIIPLADNPATLFSYTSRRDALMKAAASLPNVTVVEGSRYCISSTTFPSYFIKEVSERTDSHILLDLDIFIRHIAPALGITVRFVGEEPTDALTSRYNELMKCRLPEQDIRVVEIPRITDISGSPISASRVRHAIAERDFSAVLPLIPQISIPVVLGKLAANALQKELDLTPKPGLIDRNNSGAHTDMDYAVMQRSIFVLESVFEELAAVSQRDALPDAALLRPVGLAGEEKMLSATGGVNTHRGALFSLGLTVSATAFLLHSSKQLTPGLLSDTIARIATTFSPASGTHGSQVTLRYAVPTALDVARSGYARIIGHVIEIRDHHKRLLDIMSWLPDSNVYHRAGEEGATFIRQRSAELLSTADENVRSSSSILEKEMRDFDRECIKKNISPGGAADMLALSFFIDSLLPNPLSCSI